jgi:tripartite-type tricarboxylate transporter receptor subunit TctC
MNARLCFRHRPGLCAVLFLALLAAVASPAWGQGFPPKTIRVIVSFVPGGGDDFHGRLVAQKMSEQLGQQVIVENRPGAGGVLAWEYSARAAPDGSMIQVAGPGITVTKVLRPASKIDPWRDFAWVAQIEQHPLLLVVHPSVPATTLKELIALARSRPGQLSYGSSGIGAAPHLAGEYLKSTAKLDIQHIPYKGSAQAYIDVMAGQVAIYFAVPESGIPYVKSGKLRALGVTGAARMSILPDMPTFVESGLRDYELSSYLALLVPSATPKETIAKLNQVINRALSSPDAREKILQHGGEPVLKTPEQTLQYVKDTAAKYERIIRTANIKAE